MKVFVALAFFGLTVAVSPPVSIYGPPDAGHGFDSEIEALTESIPGGGVPGDDFPILASVPETGFSCDDQAVAGYYADTAPEAGCQVFHICQERPNGRQKDSFLCPNGTVFNQQYLVCDWWFNFDCADAHSFYSVNELIGVVPDSEGYGSKNTNTEGNSATGHGTFGSSFTGGVLTGTNDLTGTGNAIVNGHINSSSSSHSSNTQSQTDNANDRHGSGGPTDTNGNSISVPNTYLAPF